MDKGGLELRKQSAEFSDFGANAPLPTVQLDDHQRTGALEEFGSGPTPGRFHREAIGQFQSARQEPGSEKGSNGPGGRLHIRKPDPDAGPVSRERQQFQGRFGDHPEHSFTPDKEAVQIEARLVLVGSTTESGHRSIGQHHLESHHVIPSDPVLEASRTPGIGGDITSDRAISPTGRIWRIIKSLPLHSLLQ